MVDHNDGGELVSRIPTLDDLLFLCRKLNEAGARYVVIGGWAVIQHGFGRTTEDIRLLVDSSSTGPGRAASAAARTRRSPRRVSGWRNFSAATRWISSGLPVRRSRTTRCFIISRARSRWIVRFGSQPSNIPV